MGKESINDKEAICLLILFVLGTTLLIGIGGVKNDAWIAGIIGVVSSIPILAIYTRIISLFQGLDLYDILITVCGNVVGKVIAFFYIIYSFHLGALVLRNFGEFIKIVALPETPQFFSLLCMGIVTIIAVRLGIEVMARTTTFFIPGIFFVLLLVQILGIPKIHIENLKPLLGHGIKPILSGGFTSFSFPFCETVLFIGIASAFKQKNSSSKIFKWGIFISSLVILVVTIRNIGVLGSMVDNFSFPSYEAVSMIKIGDFIQRIEVTVSFVFFLGVLFKSSVCLLVASKGIQKICNLQDYRSIAIELGLLMVYLSYIIYDNSMIMNYWAFKVYPYYAFPVQVIIPIAIWILAEVKTKNSPSNQQTTIQSE